MKNKILPPKEFNRILREIELEMAPIWRSEIQCEVLTKQTKIKRYEWNGKKMVRVQ